MIIYELKLSVWEVKIVLTRNLTNTPHLDFTHPQVNHEENTFL